MDNLKDDIDFLEEVLENIVSSDLNDKEEGIRMLRDQITHMQKRHLTQQFSGQETPDEIWTNEDESAEIERQITEESCR